MQFAVGYRWFPSSHFSAPAAGIPLLVPGGIPLHTSGGRSGERPPDPCRDRHTSQLIDGAAGTGGRASQLAWREEMRSGER